MTFELDAARTFPVLLVEDNRGDARLVRELLEDADPGRYAVTHVQALADARQCLMEIGAGCVLLDLSLPDASRLEALMQLRAAAPEVPIVILSGLQDEMLAVNAVQEGAQDYLVKGRVDGHAIGRSIAYAVERKHAELELSHRAMHDALTGLPNRTLFLDRLKHAVVRAKRHDAIVGVMFVDFATAGAQGDGGDRALDDRLLTVLAERLEEGLRASDTAARFGSHEFMVLCEDVADQRDVIAIARRILESVGEPVAFGTEQIEVEATMGIAITDGKVDTAESLLRNADAAMCGAREQGIALEVFDEDIRTRARDRVEMVRQLRRAVHEKAFRLLFQPQVDLRSGEIVGLEALLRWDHPSRGLIEPVEFLWLAEEAGLINEIGDWVLEEACRQAGLWREAGPSRTPLRVCVDLSARRHPDPALVETVSRVVAGAGIGPSSLCLQITEGFVMRDAEAAVETLRALKQLGVMISMDEFGSSQSSLGALKRFPLDVIKVERSFVSGLGATSEDGNGKPGERTGEDAAIVSAVINMAHALGMLAVADGVETREQFEQLKAFGCDVGQGQYFARPRPAEAISELLGATVSRSVAVADA